MKHYHFLTMLGTILLGFSLMSNSGGRANIGNAAAALAPGDPSQTCSASSCHGMNAYDPVLSFSVIDDGGNEVTSYQLGQDYTVNINITANIGTPIGYGFQVVTLDSSNENYNAWGDNLSPGTQITALSNGREYWEHRALLPANSFEIDWTAPSTNLGQITFYGGANAANGNGTRTGDGGTNSTFTLDGPTISNLDEIQPKFEIVIEQNPISTGVLNYHSHTQIDELFIINTKGEIVESILDPKSSIDISRLSMGIYFLKFISNGTYYPTTIIVQ